MSGKEEKGELRIQIKQFLWPDCKACGGKCKTAKAIEFCKYSQPGIPKQDAIERMAKRLEYEGVNKFECHTIAKWCLDELLEGDEK